jgi:glycosyltransferase involved in cell wall biosynthesis
MRIGIFGGVQENKKLDWILEAFKLLAAALAPVEVIVVGAVPGQSEVLVERAKELPHLTIHFIGRVDEGRFIEELEKTDLCISLRHPTMGETSAVVMRALQHGVPTIVSDTGWYAELPAEVKKIPLENAPYALASVIARLLAEPDLYREWAVACAELPTTLDLSHRKMVDRIVDFLQSYRAERLVADHVASALADMGMIGADVERPVLQAIAQRSVL